MPIPLHVLHVEDSEDDAVLLLEALRDGGFAPTSRRVQTEDDMEEALRSASWDIVISDHSMPGFSSESALNVVQRSGLDIPFILVSGSIGEEQAVDLMKAGASDYVYKGNPARLVPAVQRELREAASRRSHRNALAMRVRLGAIVEATSDLVLTMDSSGALRNLNAAARRALGLAEDESLDGQSLDRFYPDWGDPARRAEIVRALASQRTWGGEGALVGKGGTRIPASLVIVAHESLDDAPYVSIVARDLSEPKRLQEQLLQAQKMESVGRLAGGVAHDFNNLLTVILANTEFALQTLSENHSAFKDLSSVLRAGRSAAALTRQLLAFSRRQVMEMQVLDPNELVSNLVSG